MSIIDEFAAGYVCEDHPDRAWGPLCCDAQMSMHPCDHGACHCGAAGMPNTASYEAYVWGSGNILDLIAETDLTIKRGGVQYRGGIYT